MIKIGNGSEYYIPNEYRYRCSFSCVCYRLLNCRFIKQTHFNMRFEIFTAVKIWIVLLSFMTVYVVSILEKPVLFIFRVDFCHEDWAIGSSNTLVTTYKTMHARNRKTHNQKNPSLDNRISSVHNLKWLYRHHSALLHSLRYLFIP